MHAGKFKVHDSNHFETRTTKASTTASDAQAQATNESLPSGMSPLVAPIIGAPPSCTA